MVSIGKCLCTTIIGVTFVAAFLTFYVSQKAICPPWYTDSNVPAGSTFKTPKPRVQKLLMHLGDPKKEFGLDFENVEFASVNPNMTIRGWWIPLKNSKKAFILVHGAGMDRREMNRHVAYVHQLGYSILQFDCREHGFSDGRQRGITLGAREHLDVLSAVKFVRENKGIQKVVLLGSSQGGASSIMAASANPKDINAVIAENPFRSQFDALKFAFTRALRSGAFAGMKKDDDLLHKLFHEYLYVSDEIIDFLVDVSVWRMRNRAQFEHETEALLADVVEQLNRFWRLNACLYGEVSNGITDFWKQFTANTTESQPIKTKQTNDSFVVRSWNKCSAEALAIKRQRVSVTDPREAVKSLKTPIMFLHGKKDRMVPWKVTEEMFKSTKISAKKLWIVDDSPHASMFNVAGKQKYSAKVKEFLNENKL